MIAHTLVEQQDLCPRPVPMISAIRFRITLRCWLGSSNVPQELGHSIDHFNMTIMLLEGAKSLAFSMAVAD